MSRPPGRRLRPSQHLWAVSRVCVVLDRRSGFGWLAESRAREPIFVYRRAFCEPPAQVPVIRLSMAKVRSPLVANESPHPRVVI